MRHHLLRFSEAQEKQIADEYRSGLGVYELAAKWGFTQTGIWHMLVRLGVPRRSASEAGKLVRLRDGATINRTYSLNENYFSNIDTPAKARWLGFIASDGCISAPADRKQLIIQLQAGDISHLQAFARAIDYDGPISRFIKRGTKSDCARLAICCTKLCDDLIRHGVTPRKSKTLQPWLANADLLRHWLGGMVDGDGSICKASSGANHWVVSLVSASLPVIEAWSDFVALHSGNVKAPCFNRGVHYCSYNGVCTPQSIARVLYTDLGDSVPLARKKAAADMLLAVKTSRIYRTPFRWHDTSLEDFERLYHELKSWNKVAAKLGATVCQVKGRRDYLKKLLK